VTGVRRVNDDCIRMSVLQKNKLFIYNVYKSLQDVSELYNIYSCSLIKLEQRSEVADSSAPKT
jgi:hypothetical protein